MGWTAAYTYSSSNTSVATVAADGTITAVAKGTATITATLNVDADDADYKAGSTISKAIDITVTKAFHTVTFSVNGNTDLTASVEEDQAIAFPTAVETTPGENEFAKVINGMTFVGWYGSTYSHASTAPTYINTASTNMGDGDVTYYAVYADYVAAVHDYVEDVLTPTSISNPSSYASWSDVSLNSSAIYAGYSTGGSSYIQLNNSDSNKGVITTASGGRLVKVTVDWNATSTERVLDIYGKNAAYTSVGNLYNNSYSGTKVGSINNKSATELDIAGDYTYVGIRSNSGALYLNSITVKWDKGTPASYEHFNTTVSALPRPEITMADVEMTWGDVDKYVAPSATVGGEAYDGSFTFTSSSANLTVGSDGKLTCNVPGNYTVTASIAATGSHQATEKTCNVVVNKKDITLTFANETVNKMAADASYTQTATVAPVAYDGAVTYAITSSTSEDASVDEDTGELLFENTGVIVVTATATATTLYNGNTASYTVYVKTTPTITVSNQTLAIGETYEPTITGGTATFTGNPAGLFTEEDGVITAVAIGTTTVTVSTAANDTYIAGEANFTLTVNGAPSGSDELPEADPVTIFNETFAGCNKSGGNDDKWSSFTIADGGTPTYDETGWTGSSAYAGSKCLAIAASGKAKTPQLGLNSETTYTLSFRAGCWNTKNETLNIYVSIDGDARLDNAISKTVSLTKSTFNTYSYSITGGASNSQIEFASAGGRFFLDDVKITRPGDVIESVELPNGIYDNGEEKNFASYCCEYPLDLDELPAAVKAYVITNVSGSDVVFKQLTGTIKGGVPFILYGAPDNYDLPTATSSSNVPDVNMLTGTLAPTYVASDATYYTFGISKATGKLVKIKGILPANKAYLRVAKSVVDALGARDFNFVFEDDMTTGIRSLTPAPSPKGEGSIYTLSGQKVQQPKKGLYIVNGKKVVLK